VFGILVLGTVLDSRIIILLKFCFNDKIFIPGVHQAIFIILEGFYTV
jgi:hypothetical protein